MAWFLPGILPSRYAPDEIWNSMFCPIWKKVSWGAYGTDANTSLSLAMIIYSVPPIVCYIPQGQIFIMGGAENSFDILSLKGIFLPPMKIEYAPDEKILDTPLGCFQLFFSGGGGAVVTFVWDGGSRQGSKKYTICKYSRAVSECQLKAYFESQRGNCPGCPSPLVTQL